MGTSNRTERQEWADWVRGAWTPHDDEVSVVKPSFAAPFCIQPYRREAFRSRASKGYAGICSSPDCTEKAVWMLHPLRDNWWARCENHAQEWTGWENRVTEQTFSEQEKGW